MPKLASAEKIIQLFDSIFKDCVQKENCNTELAKAMHNSKLNHDYFRYRFQIFKKLVKIIKTHDDLLIAINNHDIILKSIKIITDEDITGYHHYYSLSEINEWIRISNNLNDLFEIIKSYTQNSTAQIVAHKNDKKFKQLNEIGQRKEFY